MTIQVQTTDYTQLKRLTQPKRLVGKIVDNSKETRQLPHKQRVKRKR